jgi:hypothetical protein
MRSRARTPASLRPFRGPWLALVGLWTFLSGFIAAPCLHNLDHRLDHTHEGGGFSQVHVDLVEHPHPHPHATHGAPDRAELAPSAPPHGHGAAAHFGVAVTAAPVFVVPEPCSAIERLVRAVRVDGAPVRRVHDLPRPRGPPRA